MKMGYWHPVLTKENHGHQSQLDLPSVNHTNPYLGISHAAGTEA